MLRTEIDFPIITDKLTINDILDRAMKIRSVENAIAYKLAYQNYLKRLHAHLQDSEIEQIILNNISYWSGYYDSKLQDRCVRLFGCKHNSAYLKELNARSA